MVQHDDFWILRPFNALFFGVFAAFLLLLAIASLLLKGKSEKTRQAVLVTACVITLIGFFCYKYALSLDSEYNIIRGDFGGFNWWGELPLHLCNINMILIPIAVMRKYRPLLCFCFFLAPLGALMAVCMPGVGFDGYSIFLLKGFFDSLPQELYESAQLDGANEWTLFWQITMGLSKPILAVIALNAFMSSYAAFMYAFVICQDRKMWTMMVWLYEMQQNYGQAVVYASLVIAAIPTFLIFLFCQNIIMRGIVVPTEK